LVLLTSNSLKYLYYKKLYKYFLYITIVMECVKCSYKAPTNQAYDRHIASKKHLQEKPDYVCAICGYLAKTKQRYERHKEVDCHPPIEYKCQQCDYNTMCHQAYTSHISSQFHSKVCRPIIVKEIPSPSYLLQKYHKSAVKMGLQYMGYRRLSYHSKFLIYKNQLISKYDYMKAYEELENTLKNEPAYHMKYKRYAYVLDKLAPDLHYPFS